MKLRQYQRISRYCVVIWGNGFNSENSIASLMEISFATPDYSNVIQHHMSIGIPYKSLITSNSLTKHSSSTFTPNVMGSTCESDIVAIMAKMIPADVYRLFVSNMVLSCCTGPERKKELERLLKFKFRGFFFLKHYRGNLVSGKEILRHGSFIYFR
jgi:hypothetical protein